MLVLDWATFLLHKSKRSKDDLNEAQLWLHGKTNMTLKPKLQRDAHHQLTTTSLFCRQSWTRNILEGKKCKRDYKSRIGVMQRPSATTAARVYRRNKKLPGTVCWNIKHLVTAWTTLFRLELSTRVGCVDQKAKRRVRIGVPFKFKLLPVRAPNTAHCC